MTIKMKQGHRYQMRCGGWFDQAEGPDLEGDYRGSDFIYRDPKGVAYWGEFHDAVTDLGPIPAPAPEPAADAEPARPTPLTPADPPERIWLHWHGGDRIWAGWHSNPKHAEDGEQEYVRVDASGSDHPDPVTVAIMECVIWLTLHHDEFRAEYLATELARAMLKEGDQ